MSCHPWPCHATMLLTQKPCTNLQLVQSVLVAGKTIITDNQPQKMIDELSSLAIPRNHASDTETMYKLTAGPISSSSWWTQSSQTISPERWLMSCHHWPRHVIGLHKYIAFLHTGSWKRVGIFTPYVTMGFHVYAINMGRVSSQKMCPNTRPF